MVKICTAEDMNGIARFWSDYHKEQTLKRLEPDIDHIYNQILLAALAGENYTIIKVPEGESKGYELIAELFKEKGYIMKLFRPTAYDHSRYIIKW